MMIYCHIADLLINLYLFSGGILRISGIAMTPRIILMTDGNPSGSAGEDEVNYESK